MIYVWNTHTAKYYLKVYGRIFVQNIYATSSFMNILDLTGHSEHFWDETDLFGYFWDGAISPIRVHQYCLETTLWREPLSSK